jgi:hypothetical protein
MIDKAGQVTDDENAQKGDPNLVGNGNTKPVQDRRAGTMTPSCEYGNCLDYPAGSLYGK